MKKNYSIIPKLLAKDTRLARYALYSFARQYKAKRIDRRLYRGNAGKVALLYFRITPLCNLHCVMCGQRGDKGILKGKFALEEAKTIVPVQRYKELIDEIKGHHPALYFWGGEPFMYPDFMELIQYAVKNKCLASVNTNGTFLAKHAEQIVRDEWPALFVSLDGFEDINDEIRGKGSYRRVVDGFAAINAEKKKQGKHLPHMGIVTTVSNKNYLYLDKLAEAAKNFGLSWHIINLGTYTNDKIVETHKKELREKLGVESRCLEAYNTGYNEGIDGDKFNIILEKIHAMKNGYPIITVPAINPKKITEYYANPEVVVRKNCPVPWSQANIDYNGNVHFCADYNEYKIGNIKENSFNEIFTGERAKKFRKELKNSPDGIFRGCLRCYQNMLFGERVIGY
ncbi:radical SAM protein [Candidatus Lokiarchaeum ossiferum]|uniref:radical SAM protein n=1 Tax=Candidatus Lokiarchaeum ossiferum TaxID=2951803 RepID=UPI00352F0B6B